MIRRRGPRYIPFLLVCGIIAGGVTYAIAKAKVTYTASSSIAVSATSEASQLVAGEATTTGSGFDLSAQLPILEGDAVANAANARVERQLHAPLANYSVSGDSGSQTLEVVATSSHRAVAAASANAVLHVWEQLTRRAEKRSFTTAIARLRAQLAAVRTTLQASRQRRTSALAQSQITAAETRYQTTSTQLDTLLAERAVPQTTFTTLNRATPSSASPSSTNKLGALGLVLGLALGALLAFARELALGYVNDARDIALVAPEATMLARIPTLRRARRAGVVVSGDQPSDLAFEEALRRVRVNLGLLGVPPSPRTLLIASPDPHEGRSLIAANVAATWARAGRRVLLVASDLRRPDVAALLGRPQAEPGLTDLLARAKFGDGELSLADVEEVTNETSFPNLSLLGSGTVLNEPVDLLEASLLPDLVQLLARHWDVVIFDSPPLLRYGDAALLGSAVDAVILVASVGRTRKRRLAVAVGLLESVGVHQIFTVANRESGDPAPALNPLAEPAADDAVRASSPPSRA